MTGLKRTGTKYGQKPSMPTRQGPDGGLRKSQRQNLKRTANDSEMRCSEILETFGYERRRKRLQGKRAVVWAKEGAEVIQFDEASQETVPW